MKRNILIILGVIVLAIVAILVARFSSPEDSWLCEDGAWVQHGHPSAAKPTTACNSL